MVNMHEVQPSMTAPMYLPETATQPITQRRPTRGSQKVL